MQKMIEDSKLAYQARDKSQAELCALQEHADKEREEFELEFSELNEMITQQQVRIFLIMLIFNIASALSNPLNVIRRFILNSCD